MNYLAFQPAFDVFHTQFRLLRLRRLMSPDAPWHYDQLRIADFYLLFFFRLSSARLSPKHKSIRNLAKQIASRARYEKQPDDQLLFGRMARIQLAAAGTLVAKKFFEPVLFSSELVIETSEQEPKSLAERVDEANRANSEVMEAIHALITEYELLGPDGLKARTGLMEHRYDAV